MANFLNPLNPTNFGMNVTGNFNNLASSGTFRLPSSGKVSSSGPKLSIQLSSGDGAFIHDPKIKVTKQTESSGTPLQDPISRLVLDASDSVNSPEPSSRLRFIPPSGGLFAQSVQPQNGDVAYFNDGFSGLDLRLYNGTNWLSLTDAGAAPSTAAGPQYAVQFNATGVGGALGGTSDFIFNDSGVTNQLAIDAELNLSNNNNTLVLDSQGFIVTTDAAIDISNSIGTADLDISTSANLKLTTNTGNVILTSANGNIVRTSGNVTSTLSSTDDYLTLTHTNTSDFGVRISDESNFNDGVGASLYLGTTNSGGRSAILEMNVNQNLTGAPLGKLTRIYQQTPNSSATPGGYKVLYSAGSVGNTNNFPTITNLGDGNPLKYGEFYIGEARKTNRPHINYNLAAGSGFSTFNICNSTLKISDDTEGPNFVAMKKTLQLDGQITVGDANFTRVDIRGGVLGINNIDVGMITMNGSSATSGGGEFRAKSTSASPVSSVLTTAAGTNGEGRLYLYSGTVAPTSTNYGLLASGANDGTLTLGGNSANIVLNGDGTGTFKNTLNLISETNSTNECLVLSAFQSPPPSTQFGKTVLEIRYDPTNVNKKSLEIKNNYAFDTGVPRYGALMEFQPYIGGNTTTKAGLILDSNHNSGFSQGLQLGNVEGPGAVQGISMILDGGIIGGKTSGKYAALYLGLTATSIFNGVSTGNQLIRSRDFNTTGGFGTVNPTLVQNGPTVIGDSSQSAIFGWDFANDVEDNVYIGWNGSGGHNPGLTVRGSFTSTSKSFCIDHPEPEKTLTQNLYHSCIETPTAGDNLYRYRVTTVNNTAVIKLPTYFRYLNENEMIWVSPVDSFGRAYGKLSPDRLEVHVKSDQDGDYNVLVMGTRYDKDAKKFWKGDERMKKGN